MNALTFRIALALSLLSVAGTAGAQAPANAATCAGCHGSSGEGNPTSNFPRLAGQSAAYLAHQLKAYGDGSRVNSVMAPIAKGLTPEQIESLASYYAQLNAPPAKPVQAKSSERIKQLATLGDDKIGVQGCANCHGPGGIGEAPTYPFLAGQHAGYLKAAMAAWKDGSRKTDPSMQMNTIAKRLSDADVAALADYYAAQTSPAPQSARTNTPAGSSARPATGGAASQGAMPSYDKAGIEKSAPTSGGNVGPGGGGGTSLQPPGKPDRTP